MSKLSGLSLIAKDPDDTNSDVKFINTDNTTIDEPIFIAGIATDEYTENQETLVSSTIKHVAHGKFSKLSLVSNITQAVNDNVDIQKGEQNYIYVDINSGQLKTNSFSDLFENHILNTNVTSKLALFDGNGGVTLTVEQLRQLKELLPLINQIKEQYS